MYTKLQKISRLFPVTIFAVFTISSMGVSQTPNATFDISPDWATEKLAPTPVDTSFACEAPASRAKIDLIRELVPTYFDLSPFLSTETTQNEVGIRRAGKIEQGSNRAQISSRFSKRFYSADARRSATEMELSASLFFCDYDGFPEFVRANYTLSGQIGNFTVYHRGNIEIDIQRTLTLEYTSRFWEPSNGGQFQPLAQFFLPNSPDNILGVLDLTFDWKAVPFEPKEGKERLLVDIRATTNILVIKDREVH